KARVQPALPFSIEKCGLNIYPAPIRPQLKESTRAKKTTRMPPHCRTKVENCFILNCSHNNNQKHRNRSQAKR
ncbi:MAG: hypothetical protein WCI27_10605, partial [Candidatus Omnitrophota bacterium]